MAAHVDPCENLSPHPMHMFCSILRLNRLLLCKILACVKMFVTCLCELAHRISTLKYRLCVCRRELFSNICLGLLRTYDLSLVFTIGFSIFYSARHKAVLQFTLFKAFKYIMLALRRGLPLSVWQPGSQQSRRISISSKQKFMAFSISLAEGPFDKNRGFISEKARLQTSMCTLLLQNVWKMVVE